MSFERSEVTIRWSEDNDHVWVRDLIVELLGNMMLALIEAGVKDPDISGTLNPDASVKDLPDTIEKA